MEAKEVGGDKWTCPRVCNISREAREVCERYRLMPSEMIVWMDGELNQRWDKRELGLKMEESVRKVCQVEGVLLHEKGKGFFRELFADLIKAVTGRGGE